MEKLGRAVKNSGNHILRVPTILMNDTGQGSTGRRALMPLDRRGDMQPATPKSSRIDTHRLSSKQRDSVRQLGMGLFFSHRRRPIVALTLEKPRQQVGKKIGRLREC